MRCLVHPTVHDHVQLRTACALDPTKTPKHEDELAIRHASSKLFEENIVSEEACHLGIKETNNNQTENISENIISEDIVPGARRTSRGSRSK